MLSWRPLLRLSSPKQRLGSWAAREASGSQLRRGLEMSSGHFEPTGPSDAVNKSDAPLIMRSAAADGTLLQPQRPAIKLDSASAVLASSGTAAAVALASTAR